MFKEILAEKDIKSLLLPFNQFTPFPGYGDRKPWSNVDEEVSDYYLKEAATYLNYDWPSLKATDYMAFVRNGNRSVYEGVYFGRRKVLKSLLLAECLEARGRFIDDIINGLWLVLEESSWVVPAHNNHTPNTPLRALPDKEEEVVFIDLFSAETGALLTFVHIFLKEVLDTHSPLLARRIELEVEKRILEPFLTWDTMGWMGFERRPVNNWNPWILSNILTIALFRVEDAGRRAALVEKALLSLDNFVCGYGPDGGCDEGPSYWGEAGAAFFDCLELLYEATGGRFSLYDNELVKNMGRYIHRVHISDGRYINFADGSSRVSAPYALISRYGQRIGDASLSWFGNFMLTSQPFSDPVLWSVYRAIKALFYYGAAKATALPGTAPTAGNVWLNDLQVMAVREAEDSPEGFFLAAKGGHNAESHNHNDVGSFILYSNGLPVVIDPGVETYTAKTFSQRRYEIWTMQSSYHSLPEINGQMQRDGRSFQAKNVVYSHENEISRLSLNLEGAYPEEAGLLSWTRQLALERAPKPQVVLTDHFLLKTPSDGIVLNFMTSCPHRLSSTGEIVFEVADGSGVSLNYGSELTYEGTDTIELKDDKTRTDWRQDSLYRIRLKLLKPASEGVLTLRFSSASGTDAFQGHLPQKTE